MKPARSRFGKEAPHERLDPPDDLKKEYLKTLPAGKHTIRLSYYDGRADGTFTIKKEIPKTGDDAHPVFWLALVLAGLFLIIAVRGKAKKEV